MVALPLLTDPSQSIKDSRVPAAVADATQILPSEDLEHLRFLGRGSRLTCHPAPSVVVAEEVGSNIPGHAAERAAITLDIEVSDSIAGVRRLCHVRLTCG